MQGIPDLQMLSADDLALPVDPLAEGLGLGQSAESSIPASQPGLNGDFSWEMISLGLEEPLPRQDVIDELYVCSRAIELPNKPLIGRILGPISISTRFLQQCRSFIAPAILLLIP
jgi:hypothetical protein